MATNEQRRQAAKRKLERQVSRRQEHDQRRRQNLRTAAIVGAVGGTVLVLVLVLVAVYVFVIRTPSPPAATAAAPVGCTYRPQGAPSKPATPPTTTPPTSGTVALTLQTNQGAIPLTLDRSTAPCAVNAVASLAQQGFYDNTPCPRLVNSQGLHVLQCGDPTGSGSGGPGYEYDEEPPKNLPPSKSGQDAATYGRGLVAMAKTSAPGTTGSQFFLVFGDSDLPPQYTVVGRFGEAGQGVLDRVAKAGDDGSNSAGGGKPALPVQIQKAVLGPAAP